MSVFAAQWALLGVQKYPLLASVPAVPELILGRRIAIGVGVGNPAGRLATIGWCARLWSLMVATGGVLPTVVNVNESQALQSVPSKARTYMVSEPPALAAANPYTAEVGGCDGDGRVRCRMWALLGVQK